MTVNKDSNDHENMKNAKVKVLQQTKKKIKVNSYVNSVVQE